MRPWPAAASVRAVALLVLPFAFDSVAATINVTYLGQKVGGSASGSGTLQDAIYSSVLHRTIDGAYGLAIDATDPDHVITTDCVRSDGTDTIVLPTKGVLTMSQVLNLAMHNAYGPTATPLISSSTMMDGNGAAIKWHWAGSGSANGRSFAIGAATITINQSEIGFQVSGTGSLKIRDVRITGFRVKNGYGRDGGGGGLDAGGAIFLQYGNLTVLSSTFDGNGAVGGNSGGTMRTLSTTMDSNTGGFTRDWDDEAGEPARASSRPSLRHWPTTGTWS